MALLAGKELVDGVDLADRLVQPESLWQIRPTLLPVEVEVITLQEVFRLAAPKGEDLLDQAVQEPDLPWLKDDRLQIPIREEARPDLAVAEPDALRIHRIHDEPAIDLELVPVEPGLRQDDGKCTVSGVLALESDPGQRDWFVEGRERAQHRHLLAIARSGLVDEGNEIAVVVRRLGVRAAERPNDGKPPGLGYGCVGLRSIVERERRSTQVLCAVIQNISGIDFIDQ
ncbi:hypothetical protein MCX33_20995 [Methylorubrum extorquens]|nr:hypothetical protein [Methylorubrum extorquens]